MRKSLTALLALATVSFGSNALAVDNITREGFFFSPYVGADYDYTHFTDTPAGVESDYSGYNLHAGVRFHKNLGIEAGYFATETGEGTVSGFDVETDFEGANIDLMGYLPVSNEFELIGSIGAVYTHGEVSIPNVVTVKGSDWDARYGLGMQYWFNNNINTRTMVHYSSDANAGSDTVIGSVGLNLHF